VGCGLKICGLRAEDLRAAGCELWALGVFEVFIKFCSLFEPEISWISAVSGPDWAF